MTLEEIAAELDDFGSGLPDDGWRLQEAVNEWVVALRAHAARMAALERVATAARGMDTALPIHPAEIVLRESLDALAAQEAG